MEKDLYKAKYLQKPISMLTEGNLELLEKHCIKNRRQDIGRRFKEHEIVFELIQAYKEQQAELNETRNTKSLYYENKELRKELKKKDKIIDEMSKELYVGGYCKEINCKQCTADSFTDCIKQYFERKAEDVK